VRLVVDLEPERPSVGLGIDEALFESVQAQGVGLLRVWCNQRALVVGRSQSVDEEIDVDLANRAGVPILRRISGGGTVFHHPANVIVSVGLPTTEARGDVRSVFTRWGGVVAAGVAALGVDIAACENQLRSGGRKLGGAAQVRRGGALLYHTTLLVGATALDMSRYLLAHRAGYAPSGVSSKPESLISLETALGRAVTNEDVADAVCKGFGTVIQLEAHPVTEKEQQRALWLAEHKYEEASWTGRLR